MQKVLFNQTTIFLLKRSIMDPDPNNPPPTRYSKMARVFRKLHKERAKIPLTNQLRFYAWALRMMNKPYFKEWEEMPPRLWDVTADDDGDEDTASWDTTLPRLLTTAVLTSFQGDESSESSTSPASVHPRRKPRAKRKPRAVKRRPVLLRDDSSSTSSDVKGEPNEPLASDDKPDQLLMDQKYTTDSSLLDLKSIPPTNKSNPIPIFDDPSTSSEDEQNDDSSSDHSSEEWSKSSDSSSDDIPFRIGFAS